ncbi:MAG TPA: polysaccharide biosynthesis tyrosine autokinase [Acidimicrobiales bacterium]|nr:polysaccharide biosynthesis tyrosine autokinase [Acidimicrobiales bacterium]
MPDGVNDEAEFQVRDYVLVVWRRRWIVFVAVVLTVASALVVSSRQVAVYSASADFLLQPRITDSIFGVSNDATPGASSTQTFIETEIQVLESQPVREAVASQLKRDTLPPVSASAIGDSRAIRVSAESTDPVLAASTVNAYIDKDIEFRRQQQGDDLNAAKAQLQPRIAALQADIDALNAQIGRAPSLQAETIKATLGPRLDALVNQQSELKRTLDTVTLQAGVNTGSATVLRAATVPTGPVKPRLNRTALVATFVGLFLGIAMALVADQLDDTVKTRHDVEHAAGSTVPLLAMIPLSRSTRPGEIVALTRSNSPDAEAYRSLRTSVQYHGVDHSIGCLQVTSPAASDGKTTTAVNLAVVLAQSGLRMVVVDCDLRRPSIHRFFGLSSEVGLTSVVVGRATLSAALQPVPGVPNLSVLTSGPLPHNPADFVSSRRVGEVLASLRAEGATVMIDCPPLLPVTDASIMASRADATLLVVSAGVTSRKQLKRAVELLRQVGAPLAGTVFNRVTSGGAGYEYGYAYYGREGGGGGGGRNGGGGGGGGRTPKTAAEPARALFGGDE